MRFALLIFGLLFCSQIQAKEPPKRYAFPMNGRPWDEVFKWLGETTRQPVVRLHSPAGTLRFKGPKNARYTIREILSIINRCATQSHWLLINRKQYFEMVPVHAVFQNL